MLNLYNTVLILNKFIKFISSNITNSLYIYLNNLIINWFLLIIIELLILHSFTNNLMLFIISWFLCKANLNFLFFIKLFSQGLFKIHPTLFYSSIILLPILFKNNGIYIKLKCYVYFLISIISFLLGSYWASKQINWGKYWSNDSIELSLLFFIILIQQNLHKITVNNENKMLCIVLFILMIVYIRYKLIYTKHNFFYFKTMLLFFINNLILLLIINFVSGYILKLNKFLYSYYLVFKSTVLISFCLMLINNCFNLIFFKNFIISVIIYIIPIISIIKWNNFLNLFIHVLSIITVLMYNLFFVKFYNINVFSDIISINVYNKLNYYYFLNELIGKKLEIHQNNIIYINSIIF